MQRLLVEQFELGALPLGRKQRFTLYYDIAHGRASTIPTTIIRGVEPGPTLLILGAVHGDEYEGPQTIIELSARLIPENIRGTLVMVPVANVMAFDGRTRSTPEDNGNLARHFPGDPWGTPTQRLAYYLTEKFIKKSDFLLDIHSGGTHYAIPALVGYCHNDQWELSKVSREAAEAFGIDVLWGHPGNPEEGGRSTSAATQLGIPWLYTEAFGGGRVREEEKEQFRLGTLRLMRYLGMFCDLDGWIGEPPAGPILRIVGDGNFDRSMQAQMDGFFIAEARLLAQLKQGDVVGRLYNWFGEVIQTFRAEWNGVLMGLAGSPNVKAGDHVYLMTDGTLLVKG